MDRIEQSEQGRSPADAPAVTTTLRPAAGSPGSRIGPYKLLQRIGEGGMGEVWLAEQIEPIRRRVAIKIVKLGMDTEQVIARFAAERQALALMDHQAVARVFDAGSTPEGRPYFVMEHVHGEPITAYCDRHRLAIDERLRLLQDVCAGVQHAHQKGIIHRDLKPSNVLVTLTGDTPRPKVIDFGVAKAIQQKLTERTLFTERGVMIGTPEYMSPEQAEAAELDVDTRTDVYALGVMLYELLVGALPLDPRRLRQAGLDAIRQRIREQEPPRPSERMSSREDQSVEVARRRRTDPIRLAHVLKGDLDWITMKAMEKDRTRRYGSPSDLAADIGRYLAHEPVLARPPSVGYKARKFLRRHRVLVPVATLGLAALIAFAGMMSWQARRIALERNRAEWVAEFLVGLFLAPDPSLTHGRTVTARELLDRGAARIDTETSGDPALRSRMMSILGRTYEGLGLYDKAAKMLSRSLLLQREHLGTNRRGTIETMHNLAVVYWDVGRYQDAEELYREAIDAGRIGLGEQDPLTLTSMANLATTLNTLGRYAEAESLHQRVFALRRHVRGPDHLETLSSAVDLALVWQQQGRYAEAEALIGETAATMTWVLGQDNPETLKAKHNHATVLNRLERYAAADTLYREALQGMRAVLGDSHPNTLACLLATAMNCASQQRFPEADSLLRAALGEQRRVLGEHHPATLNSVYNLGCLSALRGDRAAALGSLREAVEHGYFDADWMTRDADLSVLHGDPAFEAIVVRARANGAARRAEAGATAP